jgi:hypothetical protein
MEQENRLTPQQSLALISEVIIQTKENIKTHSFIFLLWGWALAIASLLRFVLQTQTNFEYYFIPFPIIVTIALAISISKNRRKTSETYLNFFLKKLWIGLIFGFIAIVFVSLYQKIEPFTFTLVLASVGTLVSGMVMKFKPLQWGGICFLISAVCCVFISDEYKVLFHGLAIILGYLIPGYILKNSKVQ